MVLACPLIHDRWDLRRHRSHSWTALPRSRRPNTRSPPVKMQVAVRWFGCPSICSLEPFQLDARTMTCGMPETRGSSGRGTRLDSWYDLKVPVPVLPDIKASGYNSREVRCGVNPMSSSNSAFTDMQSLKGHFLIATPQLSYPDLRALRDPDAGAQRGGGHGGHHQSADQHPDHRPCGQDLRGGLRVGQAAPPRWAGARFADRVCHAGRNWETTRSSRGSSSRSKRRAVQRIIRQPTEPSLVIANYSGWAPGQLEGEFNGDSWITLPANPEYVFWTGEKDSGPWWSARSTPGNSRTSSDLKAFPADPSLN